MADYVYHIFVSYRRMDEDWVRWTRDNFVRPLRSLLRPALGDVRIFLDEQIEQVFLGLHVLLLHTHAPVS